MVALADLHIIEEWTLGPGVHVLLVPFYALWYSHSECHTRKAQTVTVKTTEIFHYPPFNSF